MKIDTESASIFSRSASISQPASGLLSEHIDQQLKQRTVAESGASHSTDHQNRTLEEALFDTRSSFKVYTSKVSMHLPNTWRKKLFLQLDDLLDCDEWDELDSLPLQHTFATFIRMMLLLKPGVGPGIGVDRGHIVATWSNSPDTLLIECMEGDKLRWYLRRMQGDSMEKAGGTTTIKRLGEILAPFHPDVWLSRA